MPGSRAGWMMPLFASAEKMPESGDCWLTEILTSGSEAASTIYNISRHTPYSRRVLSVRGSGDTDGRLHPLARLLFTVLPVLLLWLRRLWWCWVMLHALFSL